MYDIFSLPDFKMPENFLWGSSTAGHQIEGNNIHSQWWWDEHNTDRFAEKSGLACNSYALYKEDTRLLSMLGHGAYRMSVEWSRIEPEEGVFSQEAIDHYVDQLRDLKEKGIQTFVTLVHFSHPLWFERCGHFLKLDNIKYFTRYLRHIVPQIAAYTDFWIVLNEVNLGNAAERVTFKLNSIRFHAAAYAAIKEFSDRPVSISHALLYYMPRQSFDEFDVTLAKYLDWQDNEVFFHAFRTGEIVYPGRDVIYDPSIKNTCDYWSINCYVREMVDARKAGMTGERYPHKVLKMIDKPFYLEEMYPEGITAVLTRLKDKPVYITENGCSCNDDRFRIIYLALHLSAIHDAIKCGVDVRGYLYWSLLDNYEWGSYLPKFGLLSVDRETFQRTPKPSAYFYKEVIASNGINQGIIGKYLDEMPSLRR